jgi:hypothetical protein
MAQRKLSNWIKTYLAYTAESESPEEYHVWTAINAIAGAMRRKSFFHMGYFDYYPNMYIILVGPAGRCKKSTAMRIGRNMLSAVPGVSFTTDSVTRERLIQDLTQSFVDGHSSMTAYSSEFASLLTSSGMDMVVFLTDIFDSPNEWAHKTKTGGTNRIKGPWLNLIGATTPDWIAKAMPLDTVGIGLTSRIIFVYQDTPRVRPAFPVLNEDQLKLQPLLVADLISMSSISGEYKLTPEAKAMHEDWHQSRILNPNTTGDPRLNGYFERKPTHLLKLCMIVAASFRNELVIEAKDWQMSLDLLESVESKMTKVFANVGKNPFTVDYDEVSAAVYSHPGIGFGELLAMFKHSVRKEELAEILDSLVAMNRIQAAAGPKFFPNI